MINRLMPPLSPPSPGVRAREKKNTAGEDFGALVNLGQTEVPFVPVEARQVGQRPADPQLPGELPARDERDSASDRPVFPPAIAGGNDLESQTLLLSLLGTQVATPPQLTIPAVAPALVQAPMTPPIATQPTATPTPTPTPTALAVPEGPAVTLPAIPAPSPGTTATNLAPNPVENSPPIPNMIAHVVAGVAADKVEFVSVPWHLQANAGLSYRLSETNTPASLPDLMPLAGGDRQTNPSSQVAAFTAIAEAAASASAEQFVHAQGGATDFVFTRAQHSTALAEAADVAISSRTAAATLLWPHRLLRWLADSDAGMTAWVRDYRLDSSQATQLIDSLRCLAEQQGHSLHRIMLNGHELWRSPSTPDLH